MSTSSRPSHRRGRAPKVPDFPVLRPGQRVRLRPPLIEVELRSPLGTVARDGEYAGYYIIRLDEPARYYPLGRATSSGCEEITELVESSDNVDVWDEGDWRQPAWARTGTSR